MAILPDALNLGFVETLYAEYLRDADSVDEEWRRYFRTLSPPSEPLRLGPSFQPFSLFSPPANGTALKAATIPPHRQHWDLEVGSEASAPPPTRRGLAEALQDRVDQLVRSYRVRGHMVARLDPLNLPRATQPELDPSFYGLGESEMDLPFSCNTLQGAAMQTLRQILQRLRNTYCRSIGAQFMHIDDLRVKQWLQQRMEGSENRLPMTREKQVRILTRLTDAVIFEEFIQKKFLGAKSFSLEGAESLIPLLDLAIHRAAARGVQEIVLGMGHRGRLNVLANIMGKSPREIFWEFEDSDPMHPQGDVKYHLGYSTDWTTPYGKIHLSLCFNPSHLESVDAVALGRMRAKQDRWKDNRGGRGMVLLIHGDAAFAGQGVVAESLNLSQLPGYATGGTIHVVVNNQIGFTTSPWEGRSTTYATDVARMLQIPIFHVNGEDPEAVAQVMSLAMDFRTEFGRDVVIDMYCYRRRGHNEGDEPAFTQPVMYRAIEQRPSVREGYLEHLLALGEVTRPQADHIAVERRELLEKELSVARRSDYTPPPVALGHVWEGYHGGTYNPNFELDTGVAEAELSSLLERLAETPHGFHPHPKIQRHLQQLRDMASGQRALDWAAAEALAFATLASQGCRVRLSGQDSGRGTFSQRHAILYDHQDGHAYVPLQKLRANQAAVEIYNSPLSEYGVLGFEYGYTLDCPDGLIMWEAQFGDFCNGAQVIIDQFIMSAEEKWERLSGLVLLLPHGFEGMGPEHSSARLERFLSLAANDNVQVVYPTTPAQYFHCLRRQALRRWRKPLVVMTPKSLLRHAACVSSMADLSRARFHTILTEDRANVTRVLLCSGKIYYELEAERAKRSREDVALLRLEQLYPLSDGDLRQALLPYRDGTPLVWVQEEPENMGAWRNLRARLGERWDGRLPLRALSRPASASPATGSGSRHKMEQQILIDRAFS